MIRMPLIYVPEGSTIMFGHKKYTVTYKGKTGATLSSGSLTSLPMPITSLPMPICYRLFSTRASENSDKPNPFIYCDLIKAPDSFSVEEFISLHPEYFI